METHPNNLLGIYFGKAEEVFSHDFLEKYRLPDETGEQFCYAYSFGKFNKPEGYCFEDLLYYKCEIPLGWVVPCCTLPFILNGINEKEYRQIVKECWNEISFSDEFNDIMEQVDTAVQDIEKFVTIHVRSGDIVYSDCKKNFLQKALAAELAVEVIIRELPHNNVVLVGDDITSLERMREFSLQTLKEKNIDCNGHSVILAKDFIEEAKYMDDIKLVFYDCYLLSKGEKIFTPAVSAFSTLSSVISNSNDVYSCYEYFSEEEQYEIIKEYVEKLNLHPAQQSFSYYHLLILSKKIGKSFEEQLAYAANMVLLFDNIWVKINYSHFLIENNCFELLYRYFNSFTFAEVISVIERIVDPMNINAVASQEYREKFLFVLLTLDMFHIGSYKKIKRALQGANRVNFKRIYKKPFFRLKVNYYNLFNKKLH